MDFFGIGAMELLLILVLALIVVGPRQLPDVARRLARLLRKIRGMWAEVSTDLARELNVEDALGDIDIRSVTGAMGSLRRGSSPTRLLEQLVPDDVKDTLKAKPPSPGSLIGGGGATSTGKGLPASPATAPVRPIGTSDSAASVLAAPGLDGEATTEEVASTSPPSAGTETSVESALDGVGLSPLTVVAAAGETDVNGEASTSPATASSEEGDDSSDA